MPCRRGPEDTQLFIKTKTILCEDPALELAYKTSLTV